MMKYIIISFWTSLLFISCSTWKQSIVSKGTKNEAIKNAIIDFLHKGKFDKKDTVFSIYLKDIKDNIWGISISEEPNKIAVITENKIDYSYKAFPTNYMEQGGKLFYWKDSTQVISTELIDKLYKMSRVDTAIIGQFFPRRERDDSKKAMHYYFCKNNLLIYKRVYTQIGMGWYEVPELNCK